jgi:hypothetical protein
VIVRDISKSQLHTHSGAESSSYGGGEHDKEDYLTKLSLSIHPCGKSGLEGEASASQGCYPSLLLSPTQAQQGRRASADLSKNSSTAAAEAGPEATGRVGHKGDSDILEIPDWALRAYGLPDGYKPVGLHTARVCIPNSLTDVVHHSEQQQQLEQRYISAAAAVDAALMGDVHGNTSSSNSRPTCAAAPGGCVAAAAGAGKGGADIDLEPGVAKKPLGLRIPTEVSHSSLVMGVSPKPYSPLGGHLLGGLGLEGGQHESIIASSSAERGIGGHCTMR